MDTRLFESACAAVGLNLTESQLTLFQSFEHDLYEANKSKNLTRVLREECWVRHFLDSLLFQDLIPIRAEVLDIGTGPGFPAWPLACARPDLKVTALDSNGKMLGFLNSHLLPNLKTELARAEEFPKRESFDFVTGRALAALPVQLEVSAALAKVGGVIVPMRTEKDRSEIESLNPLVLGLELDTIEEKTLEGLGLPAIRFFPVYKKIKATPAKYPRKWAEITRRPLSGF